MTPPVLSVLRYNLLCFTVSVGNVVQHLVNRLLNFILIACLEFADSTRQVLTAAA